MSSSGSGGGAAGGAGGAGAGTMPRSTSDVPMYAARRAARFASCGWTMPVSWASWSRVGSDPSASHRCPVRRELPSSNPKSPWLGTLRRRRASQRDELARHGEGVSHMWRSLSRTKSPFSAGSGEPDTGDGEAAPPKTANASETLENFSRGQVALAQGTGEARALLWRTPPRGAPVGAATHSPSPRAKTAPSRDHFATCSDPLRHGRRRCPGSPRFIFARSVRHFRLGRSSLRLCRRCSSPCHDGEPLVHVRPLRHGAIGEPPMLTGSAGTWR